MSRPRHHLLHLGVGNVGGAVVRQVRKFAPDLIYSGSFNRSSTKTEVAAAIAGVPLPFTLIDTTASSETLPHLKAALKRGGSVVMSNKKPIAGTQDDFDELRQLGDDRLFYETTVGAGLPVIETLKSLLATGDEVTQIEGCFSGTLGFIFSQLESGQTFSQAVTEAARLGFTEPDPRDDLSGVDVARKALILSRLLGRRLELSDIKLEGLYPPELQKLSIPDFTAALPKLDANFSKQLAEARAAGQTLRFVATLSQKSCAVGLKRVDITSDLGALRGPDNIVVIKSTRYSDNPLAIKGPGAGVEVTAAGVFADILKAAEVKK
jgi:homoserine dehydrogenase